ncbi:hypothetical protein K437DRAFT_72664 [Tilletiaria anomala UBC 951]|uniref:DH domain-containing protein n=1 Tax=Tilletiaria anomala (strain ATCC 24038 / CBS 436.72 / UBC 951) TaxID=1037660 RepID=A0A066WI32_TILAU|nr:uncharacterized protein K437DRAFT_72664 [Tilletiaria anomala UBC 951]KDN53476.1 hypothetical protein K437DRAFT_72664 [Tilletiaria anomala UBC 951]
MHILATQTAALPPSANTNGAIEVITQDHLPCPTSALEGSIRCGGSDEERKRFNYPPRHSSRGHDLSADDGEGKGSRCSVRKDERQKIYLQPKVQVTTAAGSLGKRSSQGFNSQAHRVGPSLCGSIASSIDREKIGQFQSQAGVGFQSCNLDNSEQNIHDPSALGGRQPVTWADDEQITDNDQASASRSASICGRFSTFECEDFGTPRRIGKSNSSSSGNRNRREQSRGANRTARAGDPQEEAYSGEDTGATSSIRELPLELEDKCRSEELLAGNHANSGAKIKPMSHQSKRSAAAHTSAVDEDDVLEEGAKLEEQHAAMTSSRAAAASAATPTYKHLDKPLPALDSRTSSDRMRTIRAIDLGGYVPRPSTSEDQRTGSTSLSSSKRRARDASVTTTITSLGSAMGEKGTLAHPQRRHDGTTRRSPAKHCQGPENETSEDEGSNNVPSTLKRTAPKRTPPRSRLPTFRVQCTAASVGYSSSGKSAASEVAQGSSPATSSSDLTHAGPKTSDYATTGILTKNLKKVIVTNSSHLLLPFKGPTSSDQPWIEAPESSLAAASKESLPSSAPIAAQFSYSLAPPASNSCSPMPMPGGTRLSALSETRGFLPVSTSTGSSGEVDPRKAGNSFSALRVPTAPRSSKHADSSIGLAYSSNSAPSAHSTFLSPPNPLRFSNASIHSSFSRILSPALSENRSSASQRLQRTTTPSTTPSSAAATPVPQAATNTPPSFSTAASGQRHLFVSLQTVGTFRRSSSKAGLTGAGGISAPVRSTSHASSVPTSADREKDLPPRPKSALAGFFTRSASARSSSPKPTPERLRSQTALGGRLKGLTILRSSSASSSSSPLPDSVNGRGHLSAAPGRTPSIGQAEHLGDVEAKSDSTMQLKSSGTGKKSSGRTQKRSATPPQQQLSDGGGSGSGDGERSPRRPAESEHQGECENVPSSTSMLPDFRRLIPRRKSLLEAVFEPYAKNGSSASEPGHTALSAEAEPEISAGTGLGLGLEIDTPPSGAATSTSPPRSFAKVATSVRHRGNSHNLHDTRPVLFSLTVAELPTESALDDTMSDASHSMDHESVIADKSSLSPSSSFSHSNTGHAPSPTSRRPSQQGHLPASSRRLSFGKSGYSVLDFGNRSSAPTSSRMWYSELSSDDRSATLSSFLRGWTDRASRSRESSAPITPLEPLSAAPSESHSVDYSVSASLATSPALDGSALQIGTSAGSARTDEEPKMTQRVDTAEPIPPRASSMLTSRTIERHTASRLPGLPPPRAQINVAFEVGEDRAKVEGFNRKPEPLPEAEAKFREPTFSMADDVEFLKALEEVRRRHKVRLKQNLQAARDDKSETATRALQPRQDSRSRASSAERPLPPPPQVQRAEPSKPRQRANSASANLGKFFSPPMLKSLSKAAFDKESVLETIELFQTPLQVGQAAGKSQKGAFDNDDDWKKEVKALFVIRELVQTERSYARHLESLMQAVRRLSNPQIASAKKDRRLSQSEVVASHILSLRTLLPQLIAVSRALVTRIDEDPTAAGVGATFRVVAAQLEATFVGWSFTVTDIMEGLRASDAQKSKSKGKLGKVYLLPETTKNIKTIQHTRSPSTPLSLASAQSDRRVESLALTRPSTPTKAPSAFGDIDSPSADSGPSSKGMVTSRSASSLGFAPLQATALGRRALGAVRKNHDTPPSSLNSNGLKGLSPLDIVIMPTQRIPRYLLLLRDLQSNTPVDSLSYLRLERALDIVRRVAELCDEASHNYAE